MKKGVFFLLLFGTTFLLVGCSSPKESLEKQPKTPDNVMNINFAPPPDAAPVPPPFPEM